MKLPFSFQEVVEYERLHADRSVFRGIADALEEAFTSEQSQGLRISDSGSCSLALWAKLNDMLDLPEDPQALMFRMDLGTIVGAELGVLFQAGMKRREIPCEVEETVAYQGISGHLDISLPEYKHIYEIKSNYGTRVYTPASYQTLQTGQYHKAKGDDWTSSVIVIQPALGAGRNRIREYDMNDPEYLAKAEAESMRLRKIATTFTPPVPDVNSEERWRCGSCRYSQCSENKNPLKKEAA